MGYDPGTFLGWSVDPETGEISQRGGIIGSDFLGLEGRITTFTSGLVVLVVGILLVAIAVYGIVKGD